MLFSTKITLMLFTQDELKLSLIKGGVQMLIVNFSGPRTDTWNPTWINDLTDATCCILKASRRDGSSCGSLRMVSVACGQN